MSKRFSTLQNMSSIRPKSNVLHLSSMRKDWETVLPLLRLEMCVEISNEFISLLAVQDVQVLQARDKRGDTKIQEKIVNSFSLTIILYIGHCLTDGCAKS